MLILQRAFLLGLAAASLVTSRATGNAPGHDHILKRGVPEPPGDARVPLDITLDGVLWTRAEILDAIKSNAGKTFKNHGVEWKGNKWVPKDPLFEGGGKLTEIDLTKKSARGKFRAIVSTGNKKLVGITEHAADNNVKSVWDVKALTKEGKWLKLGVKGDRVTGDNSLHYARKDIAAAMQSQSREKVGNLWKSKVSAVSGTSKDVFYVVYDGNEFKHIEDASGKKVFEKPAACGVAPIPKRACVSGDVESEVEDKLAGPEGEDSPAAPGEEVESPPPEQAGPEPGEGEVAPESPESVALAEKFSDEEFVSFATTKKMIKSVTETLSLSIKDLRTKALGYKPLNPKSPSFKVRPGKVAVGGANVALGVVSVSLWVKGMVDAFEQDANVLDKTAAVTAIVPFVGCTTNLASQAWKGEVDGQDTALCYIGDGLLMTPLAPLGIAIHIIRWFISLGKAPKVPEKEAFVQHRDSQWEKFLAQHVYTYIYSDTKDPSKSKEKSFRAKLSSTLNIQGLAVVSEGAQKIGAAKAVAQKSLKASKDAAEKAEIEKGSVQAVEEIRAAVWNETIRRQRAYLLELPDALRDQSKASLKPMGEAFNTDYIKNVTSIQMASHYFEADIWAKRPGGIGVGIPDTKPGNLALVEAKLNVIGAHLKTAPLPLPKTFTLAYILGQSKGLEGLDARVLSPRDYLSDQAEPKISEDHINFFSLFHTVEVAKLLGGFVKEDELRNPWKSEIKDARPLHLLIAMKFGNVFEERKGSGASGPDVPPLLNQGGELVSTPSLAAITGLSEEIVNSLPKEGQFLRYKELVSEENILAMLRLARSWSGLNGNKEQTTDKAEI
ncbi:Heat-labile enterotoxin, A chain [Beauveria brongniartii RCEF 3172]|uniref:Heat-labile enterotoxin, A chain n=1 Tax=Beauveria brongniartii RCEF 3172 TaxID=1081107 RepID=A0A167AHM6_9HYPO|nr:Heat-labile enterotoxin, A chain [Beauveria brongniartii RCEF 3172]